MGQGDGAGHSEVQLGETQETGGRVEATTGPHRLARGYHQTQGGEDKKEEKGAPKGQL